MSGAVEMLSEPLWQFPSHHNTHMSYERLGHAKITHAFLTEKELRKFLRASTTSIKENLLHVFPTSTKPTTPLTPQPARRISAITKTK
ncbi:hypothetical protein Pcinc_030794 [Petrolisthes cinctipes]|uniref:Uncharacterized protein n=1 Tax=Petrolisthes cinctipes TaxID=88211 RepID=A0AAE1K5I6_PETCI|nr:hypothetical protein Pcinc_034800 [Petrolisthes cinctipes]KAK3863438.1 hypothetical protein Pcinc_030794 [Petrolisthes cinctipes]